MTFSNPQLLAHSETHQPAPRVLSWKTMTQFKHSSSEGVRERPATGSCSCLEFPYFSGFAWNVLPTHWYFGGLYEAFGYLLGRVFSVLYCFVWSVFFCTAGRTCALKKHVVWERLGRCYTMFIDFWLTGFWGSREASWEWWVGTSQPRPSSSYTFGLTPCLTNLVGIPSVSYSYSKYSLMYRS